MLDKDKTINLDAIRNSLSREGLCILQNTEVRSFIDLAQGEYYKSMNSCEIKPPRQKVNYSNLENKPHRKLAIGCVNGVGEQGAQFLQTTYFSKEDPTYPNLGIIFSYLILLRNRILGIDEDFGNNPDNDGYWNACRIHHYPSGGGFMVGHSDTHPPTLLKTSDHPFLQVLVVLSQRSRDFHIGGGYIINRRGKKIYYENETSLGSIVCFDGSCVHGVDDIDNDKIVDFQAQSGRIAGFISLYKVLL